MLLETIRGGTLSLVTASPLTNPTIAPMTTATMIARTPINESGKNPLLRTTPAVQPASATVEPTDRSIPRAAITMVIPVPRIKKIEI